MWNQNTVTNSSLRTAYAASLQKLELLAIVDKFQCLVLRPPPPARHTMRAGGPEVGSLTARRTPPKVKLVIGVKS